MDHDGRGDAGEATSEGARAGSQAKESMTVNVWIGLEAYRTDIRRKNPAYIQ